MTMWIHHILQQCQVTASSDLPTTCRNLEYELIKPFSYLTQLSIEINMFIKEVKIRKLYKHDRLQYLSVLCRKEWFLFSVFYFYEHPK